MLYRRSPPVHIFLTTQKGSSYSGFDASSTILTSANKIAYLNLVPKLTINHCEIQTFSGVYWVNGGVANAKVNINSCVSQWLLIVNIYYLL